LDAIYNNILKKTEIISIRVDRHTKEKLSDECNSKHITLNSMISQIISTYVEKGRLYEDVGFMSVRKSLLKILFQQISDSYIHTISETSCKEFFKDTAMYLYGTYDKDAVIKTLDSWFSVSNIPFRKITDDDGMKFTIHHELGAKWTLYFRTLIKSIFDELEIKSDRYVKTHNSISFRIHNP